MNQPFLCVMISAFFPLVMAALAKFGGKLSGVNYDNAAPRQSLAQLAGWPQRANWAQQNCWEAFPVFAAAVFMANHAGMAQGDLGMWAWLFIAVRLAYVGCYLANLAALRSLCWLAGWVVCLRLMVYAI